MGVIRATPLPAAYNSTYSVAYNHYRNFFQAFSLLKKGSSSKTLEHKKAPKSGVLSTTTKKQHLEIDSLNFRITARVG